MCSRRSGFATDRGVTTIPPGSHATFTSPWVERRSERGPTPIVEPLGGLREHRRVRGLPQLGRPRLCGSVPALEPGPPGVAEPLRFRPRLARVEGPATGPSGRVRVSRAGSGPPTRPPSADQPVARKVVHPSPGRLREGSVALRGSGRGRSPRAALGIHRRPCGRVPPGRAACSEAPKVPGAGVRSLSRRSQERTALVLSHRLR